MKKPLHIISRIIFRLLVLFVLVLCSNSVFLLASGAADTIVMLICMVLCFFFWIWPDIFSKDILDGRMRQLWLGNVQLRLFLEALVITVVYTFLELFKLHMINDLDPVTSGPTVISVTSPFLSGGNVSASMPVIVASWQRILSHIVIAVVFLSITFWIGIIRLYLTSIQLGIKLRIIGVVFGMIFPINLVVLGIMISKTRKEVLFENEKAILDEKRKEEKICDTKYPILLLHGVFFRDFKYFDYWGRVPRELYVNGGKFFYGEQQSAASVEECGKEVARRIMEITESTGCGKVNIIAHSKGGLDARSAMTDPVIAARVASLTTINTPHRGCEFAEVLLDKIPDKQKQIAAKAYNTTLSKFGDYAPDFLKACGDLTRSACAAFNEKVKDPAGVYIQSYGSVLKNNRGGRFPLNLTHGFVGLFDGPNDGLVGEKSFAWGSDYHLITAPGKRGISHGDVIDLNRENIPGYDVREFYVQLVADLKKKGF